MPTSMTSPQLARRFSDRLTSRRGAWIALAVTVALLMLLMGVFASASADGGHETAPSTSESARAAALLATFPDADQQTLVVVASRTDQAPLSSGDLAAIGALGPVLQAETGLATQGPRPSDDGEAAVILAPITAGDSNTDNAAVIESLRSAIAEHLPAGLEANVTGGPAFGADIAAAFDGADFTLLAVTIAIVALLLILTYRSPILWLLPLAVVGLADQVAGKVTAAVGSALGLQFDAGIISVLVFGAGTNYALLLLSRYREELGIASDHRVAMARAWRRTVPAIVASNVTVVISLLTLTLAVIPRTRGLGVAAAVGLAIALGAVLFMLPPLMAVVGRRVFWPFVPAPGAPQRDGRFWGRIAESVSRRPARALAGGLVVLIVMAAGLIGSSVGLTQVEKFRTPTDSAVGLDVLSAHFPPGEAQPMMVVARTSAADSVVAAADGVEGVVRANVVGQTADGQWSSVMVTGRFAPGTPEAFDLVDTLRTAVHAVPGGDALVGGATATDVDVRAGNQRDLLVIAPLVLLVSFLILIVLLRALLAPALLLVANVVSATAAIGLGSWLSRVVFGQPALDDQVPLLAFLFLVALGIDYTIFLVHRARLETTRNGTRAGMVNAVAHTGSVITSAGIVLAGVFAALGVLPLVVLGQLGLIVGVGVIVDTLVVRTVVVPALFGLIGDRIWWPGRAPAHGIPGGGLEEGAGYDDRAHAAALAPRG